MTKIKRRTMFAVLIMLMCMTAFSSVALADTQTPSIDLKANVKIEGPAPAPAEDYNIMMQSEDGGEPVSITITGPGEGVFPTMEYSKVGIYKYTVWQEPGTDKKCTYDNSVYHVAVYITNEENGDGLNISAAIYRDNEEHKVSEIVFTNTYEEPKAVKTGDDQNISLYIMLIIVSGMLMLILGRRQRQ